jgi:acyl-CoA hydrolase
MIKTVSQSTTTMTEMVLPTHTNALDSVFGGVIMSWIDICAAISAQRHAQMTVVTANIDDLHFVAPVYTGWIVNLKAAVNFTARTSMEIGVRVDAENPIKGESFHTASAYLTFVAIGKDGKPTVIDPITPESEEEKRRFEAARKRREFRLQRRDFFQAKK